MRSNNSTSIRGRDGRIEPEALSGAVSPDDDDVEVDGHGIDEEGEMSYTGVMEAVRDLEQSE